MRTITTFVFIFALSTSVFAAIKQDSPVAGDLVSKEQTLMALGLPFENRLESLKAQGPNGYRNLIAIMFDTAASMEARWRAVTAAGRIGGRLSEPELTKAYHHREWFMRNAALIAMVHQNPSQGEKWARTLLSDHALVVRSAAVDVIAELRDRDAVELLWSKLSAKENFRGKQSLWIRRRIVEALARIEERGHENRFVALLSDQDQSLHPVAIAALEKLTGQVLGEPKADFKKTVQAKAELWQEWGKTH